MLHSSHLFTILCSLLRGPLITSWYFYPLLHSFHVRVYPTRFRQPHDIAILSHTHSSFGDNLFTLHGLILLLTSAILIRPLVALCSFELVYDYPSIATLIPPFAVFWSPEMVSSYLSLISCRTVLASLSYSSIFTTFVSQHTSHRTLHLVHNITQCFRLCFFDRLLCFSPISVYIPH